MNRTILIGFICTGVGFLLIFFMFCHRPSFKNWCMLGFSTAVFFGGVSACFYGIDYRAWGLITGAIGAIIAIISLVSLIAGPIGRKSDNDRRQSA